MHAPTYRFMKRTRHLLPENIEYLVETPIQDSHALSDGSNAVEGQIIMVT